ncbi:sensor domain-containing diguanylate cyclase [Halalkalibacillus halophilus]|uniref:sensor domain-containing diguanylate cyclase n=1 Tax=Halalkalibacillus halophilus TaxID=392827 RepID=UPI00040590E6|nr:GGDEF domain-containing protein [Halalkalibacillus halophilus]
MKTNPKFYQNIIDSILYQIAIIDINGIIISTNDAWNKFTNENTPEGKHIFIIEQNYLSVVNHQTTQDIYNGIQSVLTGEHTHFGKQYPCHSEEEKRWFQMDVTPLYQESSEIEGAVISHVNITERVLAEEKLQKLNRKMEKYAYLDPLCGVLNRRGFDHTLESEWSKSNSISLVMFDIDNFKTFNDTYGHPKGDECIQVIGELMNDVIYDLPMQAARYGGEEFMFIVSNMDHSDVVAITEKFRTNLEQLNFLVQPGLKKSITISAGVITTHPTQDTNKDQLVHEVDQLLYQAKQQGKNIVVSREIVKAPN